MTVPVKVHQNTILKWFLLTCGCLSTIIAIIGIFLPLLPTVPLLLLAAACFARSSDRCHLWLIEHRHLGPLVRSYLAGAGIPRRSRNIAITMIWATIPPAALLLVPLFPVKLMLFTIAIGVTLYLLRLPISDSERK